MTSRERLQAVVQGGNPDQTPSIGGDALIVPADRVIATLKCNPDRAVLGLVPSPLTLARSRNLDIFAELEADPEAGNRTLDELCTTVDLLVNDILGAEADGICYLVDGANPAVATPMQYGGFFLERDREILAAASRASFNLFLIAGSQEPYIDFVSDLPAHAFAWDAASGWTPEQVKALRSGPLAADHADADIAFSSDTLKAVLDLQEAAAKS